MIALNKNVVKSVESLDRENEVISGFITWFMTKKIEQSMNHFDSSLSALCRAGIGFAWSILSEIVTQDFKFLSLKSSSGISEQ